MGVGTSGRRILHLTTFLQGGAGRIVADLACRQREGGWDPVVACASDPVDGCGHYQGWLDQLADHRIPVVPLACTFRRSPTHQGNALATLERAGLHEHLAVVHAHAAVPASVALRLRGRPPILATMHGWNAEKSMAHATADVAIFNQLPVVVVPSSASAGHLRDAGVQPQRLHVVPYGVAPPAVRGMTPADRALLAAWREDGRLVALCTGSVGPRKRQARLLDVLARPDLRDRVACAFVGEGPDLPWFEARARALGLEPSTAFVGYRDNVGDWLCATDLAVFPSSREGLPVTLLEAAALGSLVLVSAIPEHLEVVEPDVTGLAAAVDDDDAFAAALLRVLACPETERQTMRAGLQRTWETAHRPATMVEAYVRLYGSASRSHAGTVPGH